MSWRHNSALLSCQHRGAWFVPLTNRTLRLAGEGHLLIPGMGGHSIGTKAQGRPAAREWCMKGEDRREIGSGQEESIPICAARAGI